MAVSRGPVPKRESQRRRQNEPETPVDKAEGAAEVEVPTANPKWHPIAKRWFGSLARSGQSAFYEPSDWATAELIAESMSRDLKPQVVGVSEKVETDPETGISLTKAEPVMATIPLKGASLAAYLKAFSVLLVAEGDRRRARLELQRPSPGGEEEIPDVSELAGYRERLRSG
jgi:hypothetical protein